MNIDNQAFSNRKRSLAIIAVLLIVALSWVSVIDRKAQDYIGESTVQALSIFGTLRLANAAISVIKSIEVNAVVASVQFGQALDPIDDLIEDASSILKMAIGSLISQKILSEIVSTDFFKLLITVSGALLIASLFFQEGRYSGFLFKTFALVGLIRFLFVLVIFLNGMVDQAFISEKTEAEHQGLKSSSESITEIGSKNQNHDAQNPEALQIKERIDELEKEREALLVATTETQEHVVNAQAALELAEAELALIKQDLGLKERYFSNNPEYEKQKEEVDNREKKLAVQLRQLDGISEKLEDVVDELEELNAELLGGGKGFFASAKEMLSVDRIKAKAESMIDSTLNLMALLTIKSIVIPIMFLVLLLKGFRAIWGIDVRTFGAEQWQAVRSELDRKPSADSVS